MVSIYFILRIINSVVISKKVCKKYINYSTKINKRPTRLIDLEGDYLLNDYLHILNIGFYLLHCSKHGHNDIIGDRVLFQ